MIERANTSISLAINSSESSSMFASRMCFNATTRPFVRSSPRYTALYVPCPTLSSRRYVRMSSACPSSLSDGDARVARSTPASPSRASSRAMRSSVTSVSSDDPAFADSPGDDAVMPTAVCATACVRRIAAKRRHGRQPAPPVRVPGLDVVQPLVRRPSPRTVRGRSRRWTTRCRGWTKSGLVPARVAGRSVAGGARGARTVGGRRRSTRDRRTWSPPVDAYLNGLASRTSWSRRARAGAPRRRASICELSPRPVKAVTASVGSCDHRAPPRPEWLDRDRGAVDVIFVPRAASWERARSHRGGPPSRADGRSLTDGTDDLPFCDVSVTRGIAARGASYTNRSNERRRVSRRALVDDARGGCPSRASARRCARGSTPAPLNDSSRWTPPAV